VGRPAIVTVFSILKILLKFIILKIESKTYIVRKPKNIQSILMLSQNLINTIKNWRKKNHLKFYMHGFW